MDFSVNNVISNPFTEMVYDNQKNVKKPFEIQMEKKGSMEQVEKVSEGDVLAFWKIQTAIFLMVWRQDMQRNLQKIILLFKFCFVNENDFSSDWWRDCREKGIYGSDAAMLWNGGVASFFIHIYLSYVNYKNACNKSAVMVRYIYVR